MKQSIFALGLSFLLASYTQAAIEFPAGVEDFESFALGTAAGTIPDWVVVNDTPATATFTVVNDVNGSVTPRGSSTKWLRINDTEAGNVQNRFYGTPVIADANPSVYGYSFYVNHEIAPPGGAGTKPKLTVQHVDTAGFANAWGIEFSSTGASLIVLGIGGTAASVPLYSLASPTGIGDWIRIELRVNFQTNQVSARANSGPTVSLPINLSATADKKVQRFCYRGEGTNNTNRMLVDDIEVFVAPPVPAVSTWGILAIGLLISTAATLMHMRRRTVEAAICA